MKKFLSIVISILMISAMMSVVVSADAATISMSAITGLVAGESVELDVTAANGTTYTVSVNNQVFGLVGGVADGSITSVTVTAPAKATLTVNASVPATFTSQIKLQEAGKDAVMVDVSVADRILGDANGLDSVTIYDAGQILAYVLGKSVDGSFNATAADANKLDGTTIYDAGQVLAYVLGKSYDQAGLGVAYIGGNAATTIVDPFAGGSSEATPLDNVTDLYAYYYNGNLYYEFTAAANASGYTIQVGSAAPVAIAGTSGSVAASWDGTGTLAVTVVSVGDGTTYSDSTGASVDAVYSNVSGELSAWLSTNSLTGIAVTVYEIPAN